MATHLQYQQLLKQAAEKIKEYRNEILQLKQMKNESVAIIGMACQFPGAGDLNQYWENLLKKTVSVSPIDKQTRWPNHFFKDSIYANNAGFLENIDQFDARLFKLSPREVEDMDPQHRLLLMNAWHLFEDAGYPPLDLPTQKCGVFIGMMNHDYVNVLSNHHAITEYTGTGSAFSTAAGRLSYVFNLNGPCFIIDTACSSSLLAVHQACASLQRHECKMAIAGGVNLMLTPEAFIGSCKAGMLSKNGYCRSFDANADGYVRAEGVGLVLLKSLSQALADNDRIYAVIAASATNHDGYGQGLTVPNLSAQKTLLHRTLELAGIHASQVRFIEAHGTGTRLGDPIESEAIQAIYGQKRATALAIGSVKANIGHAESAAGIAGLIKTALSLHHSMYPAQTMFSTLNPLCHFDLHCIKVPTKTVEWDSNEQQYGAVSAFSFSGSNVHMILSSHKTENTEDVNDINLNLFVASAASPFSLQHILLKYADFISESDCSLEELCRASQLSRSHLEYRAAFIVESKEQLCRYLREKNSNPEITRLMKTQVYDFSLPRTEHWRSWQENIATTCGSLFALQEQNNIILLVNALACLWKQAGISPEKIIVNGRSSLLAALLFTGIIDEQDLLDLSLVDKVISANWNKLETELLNTIGESLTLENISELLTTTEDEIVIKEGVFSLAWFTSHSLLLKNLHHLYLQGYDIDWRIFSLDSKISIPSLPKTVFDLKSYWIENSRCKIYANEEKQTTSYLGNKVDIPGKFTTFKQIFSLRKTAFLSDHCINHRVTVPAASFVSMLVAYAQRYQNHDGFASLRQVNFEKLLLLENDASHMVVIQHDLISTELTLSAKISSDEAQFSQHVAARLIKENNKVQLQAFHYNTPEKSASVATFYQALLEAGLSYGPSFRPLTAITMNEACVQGHLAVTPTLQDGLCFKSISACLDSGFQLIALLNQQAGISEVYLPALIDTITIHSITEPIITVYVQPVNLKLHQPNAPILQFNLFYLDINHSPVLSCYGVTVRRTNSTTVRNQDLFYDLSRNQVNEVKQKTTWPTILKDQLVTRRHRVCMELICQEIKGLMHLTDEFILHPETHFFDMGMDSLTAMELLKQLQVNLEINDLPTALIFNSPNLASLAKYCLERLFDESVSIST